MPLLLSEHDVRRVLPMPDLIQAMGSALAEYSADRVSQPVRTVIEVGPERAYFGIMPAVIDAPAAMGAKLVTVYAGNHARGLTSHLATIILLDPATGALVALLDGRYITEARTAAVSAVSVDRLARAGATRLAIIGSGVQARSHLDAIRHVRALTDVRVWSPNASHCAAFAQSASADTGLTVRAAASARTAVRDADIVVLVTASPVPVITDEDIAPGTHICAIGACRPTQREMPTALVARSRLFVDSHAAALVEAGDIVLPIKEGAFTADHIVGELGSLVLGRCAGRQSDAEVTLFKSLGMAVEDLVAAQLVAERATAAGLGTEFSLS
ncbi:MAG TPA: ornithine cyclodeaminase family protein [Vicinamibacterales bacterium]|nr:ornithine cyclodeaminase family protein [Vicinamibacterales bacterium]